MTSWLGKCFLILVNCLLWKNVTAQREFNNWYFGSQAGITFNSGAAVPLTDGSLFAGEGVATISDAAGQLLFYTNGVSVWNRKHQVMPNGYGVLGDVSTTQAALIIPIPGSSSQYYLFTLTDQNKAGDLYYSIIDMRLDSGRGDLVVDKKNIHLATGLTEKLVSAQADDCGIWMITHQRGNSTFEARLITGLGIGSPVISNVGGNHVNSVGTIRVARNNRRLAVTMVNGSLEVFDFDPMTGLVSNPIALPVKDDNYTYSACFSASGTKLYMAEGLFDSTLNLYQFDLVLSTATDIAASKTFIATTISTLAFTDIQLGPDDKVYISKAGKGCLDIIHAPENKAPLCVYQKDGVCLGGRLSGLCLPNEVRVPNNVLRFELGSDTTLCPGQSLILNAPPLNATPLWSTGATTGSISISNLGKYWLRLTNGNCIYTDTISVSFSGKQVKLPKDTVLCVGNSMTLRAGLGFQSYLWQDGSTDSVLTISAPGLYWVEAVNSCNFSTRDSILVTEKRIAFTRLGAKMRCSTDSLQLTGPPNYLSYQWFPDYNISNTTGEVVKVAPEVDTIYILQVEAEPGCIVSDTISVNVLSAVQISLGEDTVFCTGTGFLLAVPDGFHSYKWNNGRTTPKIEVEQPGAYSVQVRDINNCPSVDTIQLNWKFCGNEIYVPSAFTPNNDGKNDVFRLGYKGLIETFEFTVFNRWGQVVFQSNNPRFSWNGLLSNTPLNSGVYVWVCRYQFKGEAKRTDKGTITLIR